MSRHRNIRKQNYDDYRDDYDDDYYDDYDEYSTSPSTLSQYTHPSQHALNTSRDLQLESCIQAVRDVVGDIYTYKHVQETVLSFDYNIERSLDFLLNEKEKNSKTDLSKPVSTTVVPQSQTNTPNKSANFDTVSKDTNKLVKKEPQKPVSYKSSSSDVCKSSVNQIQTPNKASKNRINFVDEYNKQKKGKQNISLVVIGHVDAGKSTLMGNLLFKVGVVDKKVIHKYEQDSKKLGKASFAYAWVLDETEEERNRGVTMDIASNCFETETYKVMLMDAPGHRDFIPNMITGASQADVALLVVAASSGEFESGFYLGGQTREHALLVRTFGISQLAVAVNKLDSIDWDEQRFNEIVKTLKRFLKQAGYREADLTFVPTSGLLGENLTTKSSNEKLASWYNGPTLLEVIDSFRLPDRPISGPFRFTVNDVFKTQTGSVSGISIYGKIESGGVCNNTKVVSLPSGEKGIIKMIEIEKKKEKFGLAGHHATLQLNGVDSTKVVTDHVICEVTKPIPVVSKFKARIVVFDDTIPITEGFQFELHHKSTTTPATICKLMVLLDKLTDEVIQKRPRILNKGGNAFVKIKLYQKICMEEYDTLKDLGRFTLRYGSRTVAAGILVKIIS